MPRPKKEAVAVIEGEQEAVQFVEEAQVEHVDMPKVKVDVKALKAVLWNTKLEVMQDAVKKAVPEGIDEATDSALKSIFKARDGGIASQYVQQIIARHG